MNWGRRASLCRALVTAAASPPPASPARKGRDDLLFTMGINSQQLKTLLEDTSSTSPN